jgi:hypothetical protein
MSKVAKDIQKDPRCAVNPQSFQRNLHTKPRTVEELPSSPSAVVVEGDVHDYVYPVHDDEDFQDLPIPNRTKPRKPQITSKIGGSKERCC